MRYLHRVLILAAVAVVIASPVAPQWLTQRTPGIPRMADGKPNLSAPTPRTADGKPDLSRLTAGGGGGSCGRQLR
jgi:hypothetical protein